MRPTSLLTATTSTEPNAQSPGPDAYPPAGYSWYVVGVLTLAYIFSFIDRQILSLMVVPIQHDLGINDKQMGLLMGLTFAVFYTLFGIPLGRLADTRSRRVIISVGIALWSVMTAGCGLARTFWQLAVMRMGVGVGEASLSPQFVDTRHADPSLWLVAS
jgi:MFS family permease